MSASLLSPGTDMQKSIMITGASSGIGRAAVKLFSKRGWNVAATMRTPEKEEELGRLPAVKLYRIDVTQPDSIEKAITAILADFGTIDVVVNNAGYGAVGIFEKATPGQIQKQFDTNVFGVMNIIRGILPSFRKQRHGTIINITSMGGLITFPLYSVYHATKWAVEGFTESLAFELRQFNIRIKNIEPGAVKTDFYNRSMDLFSNNAITEYDTYEQVTYRNTQKAGENAPGPDVVAVMIYKAATNNSSRMRYPVGSQSPLLLFLRRILPNRWFIGIVRMAVERGFSAR
jgi:NAD(P)-dependent dehydrogenase (short-subunit alcohol dehydrogenase family)